ncbi:MAG: ABC transporter ATP-binding protein [Atopobiaceae bacterium]|nr:ABC transporter ATP-binding protein [Atopobiaceae bacterium]
MKKADKEPLGQSPIKWTIAATRPYHGILLLLVLLSVVTATTSLWTAVLLKDVIDVAVSGDQELLVRTAIIFAVASLLSLALGLVSKYLKERTSYQMVNSLQSRLFSVLLRKDYYYVTRLHSQEWMNRINADSNTVADSACKMIPGVVGIVFQFVGTAYLIGKEAPLFLGLLLLGGALYVGLNYVLRRQLKQTQRNLRGAVGRKNIYMSEHLSKLMIVKAFDREENTTENSNGKLYELFQSKMRRLRILLMKDGMQDGVTMVASVALIAYCAFEILIGVMSYGTSIMLIRLMSQIKTPLSNASTYVANIFDVEVAAERLMEAEGYPNDTDLPVRDDAEISDFYNNHFKEICFKDAGFSYLGELEKDPYIRPTVFEHVNLAIPKRSLVAFTGITGSGKSTFFKLLMSLYPLQEGEKSLVCNDGAEIPLDASYRRLFAYVPQGNQLMAGSIREMVSFGERDAKDSDLWDVLEAACAKDFVEALPKGLDTEIGERGLGLSEGQMQRLAVARALYTNRPILLLDEATSSLDEDTEERLLQNIKDMSDRTVLIVTHRPKALSICDMEIHIDNDRVTTRYL